MRNRRSGYPRWALLVSLGLVLPVLLFGIAPWKVPPEIVAPPTPKACVNPEVPWTDPAMIMAKNPNGIGWKVPWNMVQGYASTLNLQFQRGERDHLLRPTGHSYVRANIFPYENTGNLCMEAFDRGVIVAKIIAIEGSYPRLGLARGDNYYVVYRKEGHWNPLVINASGRTALNSFVYKNHTGVTNGFKNTALSPAAYHCAIELHRSACFVDSQSSQTWGGGGLLYIRFFGRRDGESQPWAACPAFGCCCGGLNCHPDE
jgi:hypothetical protein